MPRYYFDVTDEEKHQDQDGTELRDDAQARIQAIIFAGEYLRDHPSIVWDGHRFSVRVADDAGKQLFHLKVEAVSSERP